MTPPPDKAMERAVLLELFSAVNDVLTSIPREHRNGCSWNDTIKAMARTRIVTGEDLPVTLSFSKEVFACEKLLSRAALATPKERP